MTNNNKTQRENMKIMVENMTEHENHYHINHILTFKKYYLYGYNILNLQYR